MGAELVFVKGNQQKNKMGDTTSNALVTVKFKAPIWHLYFAPKVGTSLRGMIFPPYLKVLTHKGEFIDLKYIVRPNSELMEGDKMIICEGPSGCKQYLPNTATDLKVPRCICHKHSPTQAENLNLSKTARKSAAALAKQQGTSTLHAMLGTTKAGPCPRFLAGLCPNNKKGESCSGDHNAEGAWIDTPEGKRACIVECKHRPHSKLKGFCRNGKKCAYCHSKYAASIYPTPKIPRYSPTFDSTLGFPGEGPAKIATYNINGAKDKLYHVLGAASRARIDVLLLQETHYYKTTRYHVNGIQSTAKRAGWTALHAPATAVDPKGGVAILVRADRQSVSLVIGSAPLRGLNGRLIGAECQINDERTYIYSIYLPTKPDKRLEVLLKIEQQG
jgi:hypothetical protein